MISSRSQHLTSSQNDHRCLAILDEGPWCEFMAEPGRPYCAEYFAERVKVLPHSPSRPALPRAMTFEEVVAVLGYFSLDQRSLAHSPEPPPDPAFAGDCRPGGSCGVDLNHEGRHAQWTQARIRHNKELAKTGGAQ